MNQFDIEIIVFTHINVSYTHTRVDYTHVNQLKKYQLNDQ